MIPSLFFENDKQEVSTVMDFNEMDATIELQMLPSKTKLSTSLSKERRIQYGYCSQRKEVNSE